MVSHIRRECGETQKLNDVTAGWTCMELPQHHVHDRGLWRGSGSTDDNDEHESPVSILRGHPRNAWRMGLREDDGDCWRLVSVF